MKRLVSFFMAFSLAMSTVAFAEGELQSDAHVIIDQVYGGGGKSETPISNSFIELYNLGSTEVDLTGYEFPYS
jgi:predicted extracellular nuclease